MTAKRDLKRRVRERQARTGERYTTARGHVLADKPSGGFPVVEVVDLSEEAARAGLLCKVLAFPDLVEQVDCPALLSRIRDALRATASDPGTELLRSFMLQGQRPPEPPLSPARFHEHRRFVARVQAGIGGVSESGRMLALHAAGKGGLEMVLCIVDQLPVSLVQREPYVLLVRPGALADPLTGRLGLVLR